MDLSDTIQLVGEGEARRYRCRRCEQDLGPGNANYKLSAAIEQTGLEDANRYVGDPARFVDVEMVLRRIYCPGCAVLLDTEVARRSDPPLHDIEIV